jgi:hypothetical protein
MMLEEDDDEQRNLFFLSARASRIVPSGSGEVEV